jgi:DNA-binding NarL/FixJ family response regulator
VTTVRTLLIAMSDIAILGLRAVLSADREIHIVGTVSQARRIARSIKGTLPDVIVLEDTTGSQLGDSPTPFVQSLTSRIPVLVVSSRLGARPAGPRPEGFLHISATAKEICRAVKAIASGGSVLDPRFTRPFVTEILQRSDAHRRSLSPREGEVMQLVAQGFTDPEIATRLGLSANTVKTYVHRSLTKLDCPTRAAAATQVARWTVAMGGPSRRAV